MKWPFGQTASTKKGGHRCPPLVFLKAVAFGSGPMAQLSCHMMPPTQIVLGRSEYFK